MNKLIWIIVILLVLFGGYALLVKNDAAIEPVVVGDENEPTTPGTTTGTVVTPGAPITSSVTVTAPVITYLDNGFNPARLVVKRGTTVSFQNGSISNSWPASANHPTHSVYPLKGGCSGSAFDACKGFKPGEEWSFRFDSVGTWGYHDHLHSQHQGVIVVE